MDKTFYDIVKLSDEVGYEISEIKHGVPEISATVRLHCQQMRVQLAIAQQLSVISGTLKDLLELCQSQSTKPSSKTTKAKS